VRLVLILTAALVASAAARPAPAPAAAPVRVTIENVAYAPASASAFVGDTVEWVNKDPFVHTATAKNGAWKVVIQPGKSASLKLTKTGAFDYYCEFHPNMTAKLTVAERPKK